MRVLSKSTFFPIVCPLKKDCLTLLTGFWAPYWIALQLAFRQKGWRELIFKILCTQAEHSMFVRGCCHAIEEAWISLQGTLKCQDWNTSVLGVQCPGFVAYTCFLHIWLQWWQGQGAWKKAVKEIIAVTLTKIPSEYLLMMHKVFVNLETASTAMRGCRLD